MGYRGSNKHLEQNQKYPHLCVCGLFGAHNRTINGDIFDFALNVCLTPCKGGPKLEKCFVFYLKIHYSHMVQDKVIKLTCPSFSMTGSCLKIFFFLNVKIMAAFIF